MVRRTTSNEAYANDVRYQDLATGAWTLAAAAGTPPFDDLDVAPGDEYDYALAIEGGAGVLGAVHVTVPSRLGLRLEGARPNPAVGGGFAVAFALDRQAPGDLELLDLAGRRIDRVGLGSLPPGNHVLRLAAHQGLAPGVYLVRLMHAGRTLDRRAVMIH